MSLYRHQRYWNPCRRGSFSSGSGYGGSGQRICYYPQSSYGGFGRSYYPQSSYGGYGGYGGYGSYGGYGGYGGYGRSYYPQTYCGGYGRSFMPPISWGGYGYGRGYYPQQGYGGYGYGRRYGFGYGSRRGSICYSPCGYSSGGWYPQGRRHSCSSIDGHGKILMDF